MGNRRLLATVDHVAGMSVIERFEVQRDEVGVVVANGPSPLHEKVAKGFEPPANLSKVLVTEHPLYRIAHKA